MANEYLDTKNSGLLKDFYEGPTPVSNALRKRRLRLSATRGIPTDIDDEPDEREAVLSPSTTAFGGSPSDRRRL